MNNIDILKKIKNIDNLELVASNIKMQDGSTVEDAVSANKTSIHLANENISALQEELFGCKDSLKKKLIDKKIEGLENENNLSALINNVDKLKSGAKLYLFKDGDECVDITGGFVDTGTNNGSMINNGTSLVITANKHSSGFKVAFANTNKLISLKGYSTLKVDCSLDIKDITNSGVVMGVHTSKGAYPGDRFVLNKNSLNRTIVSLHVEDITTDMYFIARPMIEANSTATSVTCRIYKIWLEA